LGGLLTTRTKDQLRGGSGARRGLTGKSLLEHLLRDALADVVDGLLDMGKGRAPGRPIATPEAIHQIFGDAVEVEVNISVGVNMVR
jgi:hypothetical protein